MAEEIKQTLFASEDELADGKRILYLSKDNVEQYRKGQAVIQVLSIDGEPLVNREIHISQKSQDFLFGNLVFDLIWSDPVYKMDLFKARFRELFNFAIFPFYWSTYEKTPGMSAWQKMLPVLEWCLANGITPKGHPLVWPYNAGVPEWLYDIPPGMSEILTQSRVTNIVRGFQPYITTWDVTNEAINHITWEEASHPDFKKRYHDIDLWRGIEVAGSFKRYVPIPEAANWVEKSIRWAYDANPMATLIVNDYNQEIDPYVRQRFFDLIRELQNRGTPISGIGLQVHPLNHWLWPQQIWETLEMYKALQLPIHITELHQPCWEQEIEGGWRKGFWTENAQAEYIEQLYRLFYGHPSVVSINYWGLSDREIWIPGAGLIDRDYRPKSSYQVLQKLIKNEWLTPDQILLTDNNGVISFYGFYGNYELAFERQNQQTWIARVHLSQFEQNKWAFTIR